MSGLFRQAALDKASSPEQLDRVIRIVRPVHAWALGLLAAAVLGGIAWSALATASITVKGRGILLSADGVAVASAPADGTIEHILVRPAEPVVAGQAVAILDRPASRDAILAKRAEAQGARRLALARRTVQQEHERRMAGLGGDDAERAARLRDEAERRAQDIAEAELRAQALARELDNMERDYERKRVLTAPVAGTVAEVNFDRGDRVKAGQVVLRLLPADAQGADRSLGAIVFVPNEDGKKVRPGMAARIMPSTTQLQKDGFIRGTVLAVAPLPSSREGIMRRLRNAAHVDALLQDGAPFEVELALDPDPAAPSGFRWSSGPGPDIRIDAGTIATAEVVVGRRRVISLALPALEPVPGQRGAR